MKISFIATILNEEKHISLLLDSLLSQTQLPDEVILVDGGSRDKTVSIINNRIPVLKSNFEFELLKIIGNRSIGRNAGIKHSTGDFILISDAGCILRRDWIENIIKPFKNAADKVDVVAGYYQGKAENIFEKSVIPYVLVMPDKINPREFLPASRSMAFKKNIWKNAGGFPEDLSHNEDYVFAKKLKGINAKISFQKDAIVYWLPRNNLFQAYKMFYRFAYGDAEASVFRPKVFLIFLRYFIAISLFLAVIVLNSILLSIIFIITVILYTGWSIVKNYKYVKDIRAFIYLPLLQLTSDIAILAGTISGLSYNQLVKARF